MTTQRKMHIYNHYEQTREMLRYLLASRKITLLDVPFTLRFDKRIYKPALKRSRHHHEEFITDIEVMMADILKIVAQKGNYLHDRNLHEIMRLLHFELKYFFSQKEPKEFSKFRGSHYDAFEKQLLEKLGIGVDDIGTFDRL